MEPFTLDALVMRHVIASHAADGYATGTHSGVAAVLQRVAAQGRALAAQGADLHALLALLENAATPD